MTPAKQMISIEYKTYKAIKALMKRDRLRLIDVVFQSVCCYIERNPKGGPTTEVIDLDEICKDISSPIDTLLEGK
jgi:hypothetical protein